MVMGVMWPLLRAFLNKYVREKVLPDIKDRRVRDRLA